MLLRVKDRLGTTRVCHISRDGVWGVMSKACSAPGARMMLVCFVSASAYKPGGEEAVHAATFRRLQREMAR